MKLECVKLDDEAILPTKSHEGDAGFDLWAVSKEFPRSGYVKYKFGLAVNIPEGYVGLLFPRSSIYKLDVTLANSVGVIDHGYTGEVSAIFRTTKDGDWLEKAPLLGKAVAQLVIVPMLKLEPEAQWVDSLPMSSRQDGGFGSTDN